ncbi:MAG: DUF1289 domain-containing protein [Chlorobia bacterium]|nr:DUF1289 domain-containing protein [Fimbriimonadaceae bacterium]
MNGPDQTASSVASPCRKICQLGNEDTCLWCLRTLDEIARWTQMSDREKMQVWERVGDSIE